MKRNYLLDIQKFFAAFCIILIHFGIYNAEVSCVVVSFCRFAVPFFFMVTGFYFDSIKKKGINKYFSRILLMVLATLVVTVIHEVIFYPLSGYYDGFGKRALFNLLVLNDVSYLFPNIQHLWYIASLLYAVVIFNWMIKHVGNRGLLSISIVLLVSNMVLASIGYMYYVRNFLFFGIPYITLGYLCKVYQKEMKKIPGYGYLAAFLVFSLLVILEWFYLDPELLDHCYFTPLQTVAFLGIGISGSVSRLRVDAGLSSFVYFSHIIVGRILRHFIEFDWTYFPIEVFLTTILLYFIIKRLARLVRRSNI